MGEVILGRCIFFIFGIRVGKMWKQQVIIVYIYREREREKEIEKERERERERDVGILRWCGGIL